MIIINVTEKCLLVFFTELSWVRIQKHSDTENVCRRKILKSLLVFFHSYLCQDTKTRRHSKENVCKNECFVLNWYRRLRNFKFHHQF